MKELFGLLSNVHKSPWTTAVGVLLISLFAYTYVTADKIELMSVDTVILGIGVSLLIAPDKLKTKEKE